MRFAFEGCELDLQRVELRREGQAVPVEPQVFDVLVHLLRHRDRVVPKEELDLVGRVVAPSLVILSRGDVRLPIEGARQLAAQLPDGRFVILDSANHLLLEDEAAWPRFLAEVDAFITELP